MARIAFSAVVSGSGPVTYTVPADKIAVFAVRKVAGSSSSVLVNGVSVGAYTDASELEVKPITAMGGDVVSFSGGTGGINGFLYDA